jgi:hypothetical protein
MGDVEKTAIEVTSHYEVDSGDFLLLTTIDGIERVNKLITATDADSALRVVAGFMTFYLIHHGSAEKIELKVAQYDSPLKWKLIRTITIK